MVLDVIFFICLAVAFINGFRRGLIRALFSFVGLFFGVLLALKYSYVVSDYLYREQILQTKFLPLISFIAVFLIVVLLVNITARLVESAADAMLLGIANKLIGGVLEVLIIIMLFSTLLWYLDKMHFISPEMEASSKTFDYLVGLSPDILSFVSQVIPFFSDVFEQLEKLLHAPQRPGSVEA
jgi:membrane protein required for colicin V production